MKIYALIPLLLVGCARFNTGQYDERLFEKFHPETGKLVERERTRIQTDAGTTTFFDGDSALSNFHAAQTEKSQTAKVGSLNQSTTGTNAIQALEAFIKAYKLSQGIP